MVRFNIRSFVVFIGLSTCLTLIGFSSVGSAKALRISSGRVVEYTYNEVSPQAMTLVFLPGVNRSVPTEYDALGRLSKLKYNILTLATSSHWESLKNLNSGETPFFSQKTDLTSADFMQEAEFVIKKLNIAHPLLVGLSYSSSMQVKSNLPQVFVAPLVKDDDTNPTAAAQAKAWEAGLALNPMYGAIWIRQFRDSNYRQYWNQRVTQSLAKDKQAYEGVNSDLVINGYVSITRATENFNLANVDLASSSFEHPHVFILGGHEQKNRLRGQLLSALRAINNKQAVQMIFVRDAEHNVPSSQPAGFVKALTTALETKNGTQLEVGVVSKDNKKVDWLNASDIKKLFGQIMQYNDMSTDLSDIKF